MVLIPLIGIIIVIVFVVYGLGIGTEAVDDILAQIREQAERQNDQADPDLEKTGNFATDGKKICDLELQFAGQMHDLDPFGFDPINIEDDRFLVMGEHFGVSGSFSPEVQHRWFCPQGQSPFSLFAWELGKTGATKLSFGIDESAGEIVRMKYRADSVTTGKRMFDCSLSTSCFTQTQWQASTNVGFGGNFPVEWRIINVYLEEVTGDEYELRYWSDNYQINGKKVGHIFSYHIPSP